MVGDMQWPTLLRFLFVFVGGILLPILLLTELNFGETKGFPGRCFRHHDDWADTVDGRRAP